MTETVRRPGMRDVSWEELYLMLAEEFDGPEITPEMIEAGARVLEAFERRFSTEAYWAPLVYRAMWRASKGLPWSPLPE